PHRSPMQPHESSHLPLRNSGGMQTLDFMNLGRRDHQSAPQNRVQQGQVVYGCSCSGADSSKKEATKKCATGIFWLCSCWRRVRKKIPSADRSDYDGRATG